MPLSENEGILIILKLFDNLFVPKLFIFPTKYILGNYSIINGSFINYYY